MSSTTDDDKEVVVHIIRYKDDYYKMLKVDPKASQDQIKTAYRRLALKCHPDKNKHPQAVEAFKHLSTANSTLSDDTKRRTYDRRGAEGLRQQEGRNSRGQGRAYYSSGNTTYYTYSTHRGAHNLPRDFFEEFFFGGAQEYPPGRNRNQEQGEFNMNYFMALPIFVFLLIAIILQTVLSDISSPQSEFYGSSRNTKTRPGGSSTFSLTRSPSEGLVFERMTELYGYRVKFFTTARWAELMDRRSDIRKDTDLSVLKAQRDYLGKLCEAETFRHRTKGKSDPPEVCLDYQRMRKSLG